MKTFDVKSSTYIDFNVENGDKDSKFEVGDHVRISKYKNIFAKDYTPNKKNKITVQWTYAIEDINGEKKVGMFYEKELQKSDQTMVTVEKVDKRKDYKLYTKWEGYDNSLRFR